MSENLQQAVPGDEPENLFVNPAPNGKTEGPVNPESSASLDLAASLIDTSGTGIDQVVDSEVTLSVGKQAIKGKFFRIHPTLHADVNVLEAGTGTKATLYAVVPSLASKIDYVKLVTLFFGVTREGQWFLWPINAVSSDEYSKSARQIAIAGMTGWVRFVNIGGRYIKRAAKGCLDEPKFPTDKTFADLLLLGFGEDRIIKSLDHPLVQAQDGQ